jgi:thioredoxin reductase (NADPH)
MGDKIDWDLIVVGGGPAGLSCAVEGVKAGLRVVVLEKGSVVDAIRRFPVNMAWFSTPELLEIGGIPFIVPTVRPNRTDTLRYYQKVATHYGLEIRPHDPVEIITPGARGFSAVTRLDREYRGRHVVVATGYFDHPNRLGIPGEDLGHVYHYYSEPFDFFGGDVVVVGGRNSAVEAALDLYRNGVRVTLVHRGDRLSEGGKYWILPDIENRLKAGQVRGRFLSTVREIRPGKVLIERGGKEEVIRADAVFVLTGFRPDTERLKAYGIPVDPETLAPIHNPETYETNIAGLFVAGSVVAGRDTNRVFVENGRLHGATIVREVVRRLGDAKLT